MATDGEVQHGYAVAELTGLHSRPGWPEGDAPDRPPGAALAPQMKNMTDFERSTGWVYSVQATNIGHTGIGRLSGTGSAQFLDVRHRHHTVLEDRVRIGKACGLRLLPSQSWTVNASWMLAANIAADLDTWLKLLGLRDQEGLADAEIATMRHRLHAIPAKLVRYARKRILRLAADWPWSAAFALCWRRIGAIAPSTVLPQPPPHRSAAERRNRGRHQAGETAWRRRNDIPGSTSHGRGQTRRTKTATQTTMGTDESRPVHPMTGDHRTATAFPRFGAVADRFPQRQSDFSRIGGISRKPQLRWSTAANSS